MKKLIALLLLLCAPLQAAQLRKFRLETEDGSVINVQAEKCLRYYDGTTLGCSIDNDFILVTDWNKLKHFKDITPPPPQHKDDDDGSIIPALIIGHAMGVW